MINDIKYNYEAKYDEYFDNFIKKNIKSQVDFLEKYFLDSC